MQRTLFFILACLAAMTAVMRGQSHRYRNRWVYVSTGLESNQELDRVEGIARTASEHGLNGMLLSAGFDAMDLKSPETLVRITRLKQTCDLLGVEIIPTGFGVGYGGGVLAHDKNLAAGLPVRGALFVAGELCKLGYKTLGAAYYDADDLENPKGWMESLDRTHGAIGIMYTTWENQYQLLPAFGDLASK